MVKKKEDISVESVPGRMKACKMQRDVREYSNREQFNTAEPWIYMEEGSRTKGVWQARPRPQRAFYVIMKSLAFCLGHNRKPLRSLRWLNYICLLKKLSLRIAAQGDELGRIGWVRWEAGRLVRVRVLGGGGGRSRGMAEDNVRPREYVSWWPQFPFYFCYLC